MSATAVWLYLESLLPRSRDLEPGILSLAVAALVGILKPVNFLDTFGPYDKEGGDEDLTHTVPAHNNATHSVLILIALWYTTLFSMLVVNRRLVHQNAEEACPIGYGQLPKKDHLLFGFHFNTSQINFAWQLRNSRVAIFLVFAMLASCLGESWPLEMNTTVASLVLMALIVGFQIHPTCDDMGEKRSLPHVAGLGFSTLMATVAIGLNRHGVLYAFVSDPKSDWKAGTWSALVFYQLFVAICLWLEARGSFPRMNHVEEPQKMARQDEEKQSILDANTVD